MVWECWDEVCGIDLSEEVFPTVLPTRGNLEVAEWGYIGKNRAVLVGCEP